MEDIDLDIYNIFAEDIDFFTENKSNVSSSRTDNYKDEKSDNSSEQETSCESETNKLSVRQIKRRQSDILRKIKNLQVPQDDIKRKMMNVIFDCIGCHDFNKLRSFLKDHAMKQLLFKYDSPHDDSDNFKSIVHLPKKVEIRGIENFTNFCKCLTKSSPDLVYTFLNTTIRNNGVSCSVTSSFTFNGTPLYDILLMKPDPKANKKKKRKLDNKDKSESNIINLTELSIKSDILDLSKHITGDESKSLCYFETGSLLKTISTYNGEATATIHINKDNKIYLFEYVVSSREKISKYRF